MSERKAAALERLLQDERHFILAGRFDDLQKVTERKLESLSQIPEWDLSADRLTQIATGVTRNQSLLDASIRGMKAARERINAVVGAAGSLSTYDHQGQKQDLGTPRMVLRKKA